MDGAVGIEVRVFAYIECHQEVGVQVERFGVYVDGFKPLVGDSSICDSGSSRVTVSLDGTDRPSTGSEPAPDLTRGRSGAGEREGATRWCVLWFERRGVDELGGLGRGLL